MAARTTTAIHIDETKQVAIVMEPFRLRIVTALPKYIGRMQHTDMKKTNEKFGCVMNLWLVCEILAITFILPTPRKGISI